MGVSAGGLATGTSSDNGNIHTEHDDEEDEEMFGDLRINRYETTLKLRVDVEAALCYVLLCFSGNFILFDVAIRERHDEAAIQLYCHNRNFDAHSRDQK